MQNENYQKNLIYLSYHTERYSFHIDKKQETISNINAGWKDLNKEPIIETFANLFLTYFERKYLGRHGGKKQAVNNLIIQNEFDGFMYFCNYLQSCNCIIFNTALYNCNYEDLNVFFNNLEKK